MRTRSTCRACGGRDLTVVVDLGDMPLAGDFRPADDPTPAMRIPLRLWFCHDCTLCQVLDVVDTQTLFGDYRYASSTVSPLVRHFDAYAAHLARLLGGRGTVVEFGANDGVLLGPLRTHGLRAVGVDASPNVSTMARERGHDVRTGMFDRAMARELRDELGAVDVVTGSNVFAHVDDVHEVVEAALVLLAPTGRFIVEVHDMSALLHGLQFDTIYHEHLCEYSARSLDLLMRRHGLAVIGVERVAMHGGALRVTAARQGVFERAPSVDIALADEASGRLGEAETWRRFGVDVQAHISSLCRLLDDECRAGRRVHGYGAAGRATVLLNAVGAGREQIERIYDASPLRAGRVVPGVRIPIVDARELRVDPPETLLVLAWNYADAIVHQERWFAERGGSFFVPLPKLRRLDLG